MIVTGYAGSARSVESLCVRQPQAGAMLRHFEASLQTTLRMREFDFLFVIRFRRVRFRVFAQQQGGQARCGWEQSCHTNGKNAQDSANGEKLLTFHVGVSLHPCSAKSKARLI